MALVGTVLLYLVVLGLVILLFWLYATSIEKVFEQLGFSRGEAGIILLLTLLTGPITIPLFPYNGYWIGIDVGGALIPVIVCGYMMVSRRVGVAEGVIGVVIVAYVTYFVTRAVAGAGIVADFPWAFAPAVAAGFFAFSTFWIDVKKAAPLAYFSGVIGTVVGADVFHLGDILSFPAPSSGTTILSIGGAQIFDLVYMSGIIAVGVDLVMFWVRRQEKKHGFERVLAEFEQLERDQPYAKEPVQTGPTDVKVAPPLTSSRKKSGR